MDKFGEFLRLSKLAEGETIDWDSLYKSPLSLVFDQMAKTYQNPKYHGEIDVLTHTKMVCQEIVKDRVYLSGSKEDKIVLFFAALLHDIGKISCTVEIDGELKSPHHSTKGAIAARAFLWQELGLCGDREKQELRESICTLIRYHSFPPYAIGYDNADFRLLKIASCAELCPYFSLDKLCALERADVLGRISKETQESLEKIEYCRSLCEEIGCLNKPHKFADSFSQRAFFKGQSSWKDQKMFNDSWGKVILMSGLPGTGKDTYISENCFQLPVISLDAIRKELGISPKEKQGAVVSLAQKRARELLRKKQSFVWNATNITAQTRNMQISLFEDYNASVETVFLETSYEEQMRRNQSRKDQVPENVIGNMFSKLVLPERFESEKVLWLTV